MEQDNSTDERVIRFVTGEPTDDDILDVSKRISTIMADFATRHLADQVTLNDRRQLLDYLSSTAKSTICYCQSGSPAEKVGPIGYLPMAYPETVFPLGYDEIRYAPTIIDDPTVSESAAGFIKEMVAESETESDSLFSRLVVMMMQLVQYRSPDGVWHDSEGLWDKILPAIEDDRSEEEWAQLFSSSWLQRLETPCTLSENVLSLPTLQLPSGYGDSLLHSYTKGVLKEINNQATTIRDIHWRTLEEIVAELLFDLGLDVSITERSHDGGRDVVARGELIPGEPTLIAVEVKHRRIVPISELRQAMWANRHFPALLFVTSGQFSAGIYKERLEKDSMLRLYLKDGQGLSQWIRIYVRRNFRE